MLGLAMTRIKGTVRRLIDGGRLGPLVIELTAAMLTVRPYRARTPILEATYGEIVTAVLWTRRPARRTGRR
jgi:hypothetical protein